MDSWIIDCVFGGSGLQIISGSWEPIGISLRVTHRLFVTASRCFPVSRELVPTGVEQREVSRLRSAHTRADHRSAGPPVAVDHDRSKRSLTNTYTSRGGVWVSEGLLTVLRGWESGASVVTLLT